MAYTTYYLRFASETEADAALFEAGYLHEDTFEEETRTYYAVKDQIGDVDIVGEIWNSDGVFDEETLEVITPPTKKDGWHVNVILEKELPEVLQEFAVAPRNPYRVFA